MIPSISGGEGGLSSSSADSLSSGPSGNVTGNVNSADRITKQFFNISGGASNLDLNRFFAGSNTAFSNAVSDTNKEPESNTVKYVAIASGTFIIAIGLIAWSKK